ncbi:hypothetical protein ERHA54_11860 [Erwinia rhapontici]|nr:hypothetical protein [Erwinia rhapontici]BCQ38583.1 hypothetical protein ERHA54_11860 [Erwinia rhapontici]
MFRNRMPTSFKKSHYSMLSDFERASAKVENM